MTRPPSTARTAFTLVELLVVISIIAVLMGLLLPAVQKIRGTGPRVVAKNDITNLETAVTKFKQDFGFTPPSVFVVPTAKNSNDPHFVTLARLFDRWANSISEGATITPALPYAGQTLTGNQALVLFLSGPTGTGWAVDSPAAVPSPTATAKKGPYYDFPTSRLQPGTTFGLPSAAPVLVDPFGSPYAYFGSTENGYLMRTVVGGAYTVVPTFTFNGTTVRPYRTGPAASFKWVNQNMCQIISAGELGAKTAPAGAVGFGPGDLFWTPGSGVYVQGQAGGDDIANFNEGKMLGVN